MRLIFLHQIAFEACRLVVAVVTLVHELARMPAGLQDVFAKVFLNARKSLDKKVFKIQELTELLQE